MPSPSTGDGDVALEPPDVLPLSLIRVGLSLSVLGVLLMPTVVNAAVGVSVEVVVGRRRRGSLVDKGAFSVGAAAATIASSVIVGRSVVNVRGSLSRSMSMGANASDTASISSSGRLVKVGTISDLIAGVADS